MVGPRKYEVRVWARNSGPAEAGAAFATLTAIAETLQWWYDGHKSALPLRRRISRIAASSGSPHDGTEIRLCHAWGGVRGRAQGAHAAVAARADEAQVLAELDATHWCRRTSRWTRGLPMFAVTGVRRFGAPVHAWEHPGSTEPVRRCAVESRRPWDMVGRGRSARAGHPRSPLRCTKPGFARSARQGPAPASHLRPAGEAPARAGSAWPVVVVRWPRRLAPGTQRRSAAAPVVSSRCAMQGTPRFPRPRRAR